jgi:hypothetical protein
MEVFAAGNRFAVRPHIRISRLFGAIVGLSPAKYKEIRT